MCKKILNRLNSVRLLFFFAILLSNKGDAQVVFQPYSYQFYQKMNTEVFNSALDFHTSIKPYLLPDEGDLRNHYDSLMTPNKSDTSKKVLHQMFIN